MSESRQSVLRRCNLEGKYRSCIGWLIHRGDEANVSNPRFKPSFGGCGQILPIIPSARRYGQIQATPVNGLSIHYGSLFYPAAEALPCISFFVLSVFMPRPIPLAGLAHGGKRAFPLRRLPSKSCSQSFVLGSGGNIPPIASSVGVNIDLRKCRY